MTGEAPPAEPELRDLGALSGDGGCRDQGLRGRSPARTGLGRGESGARLHRREGSGLLCPRISQAGVEVCCRVEHGLWGVIASQGRQLPGGNDTCLEKGTGAPLPALGAGTAARGEDLGCAYAGVPSDLTSEA